MSNVLLLGVGGVMAVMVIKNLWDDGNLNWLLSKQRKLELQRGLKHINYDLSHLFHRLLPAIDPKRFVASDTLHNRVKANTDAFDLQSPARHQRGVEERIRKGYIQNQATGPRGAVYKR